MKIGILQCGHASAEVAAEHGDYAAMFARLLAGHGFEFAAWNVVDMEFPPGIHAADGWLLTGSKHGAYDDLPFIAPLERFVRAAHAEGVPLAGVCFGHQLIAQALGGKVEKYAGGWAVGRQSYAFEGLGRLTLNAWHQDQVTVTPPGARRIASSDFCRNAGLAWGDSVLTVQAHPEFGDGVIAGMIRQRRDSPAYPAGLLDAAEAGLKGPTDSARVGEMIARFFLAHAQARTGAPPHGAGGAASPGAAQPGGAAEAGAAEARAAEAVAPETAGSGPAASGTARHGSAAPAAGAVPPKPAAGPAAAPPAQAARHG